MKKKYFGTDGIRGEVGIFPMTADFAQKLGWAAGKVFKQHGFGNVILGKDTRISGYMLESALESGFSAAGVNVRLVGPIPTPAIAYLTRTFKADSGVVITASHNPFTDNGIKFFSDKGEKISDEIEAEIEALLDEQMQIEDNTKIGKASRINDAQGRYIEFCKSTMPNKIDLTSFNIVLDCANGAAYKVAPAVFSELGAEITIIGASPDGLNINKNCGSTHLENLQKKVLEVGADFGIAFDGDADRVLFVDDKGEVVDGDEILYLIVKDMKQRGKLTGGVVGTSMSNVGLEVALQDLGVAFLRSDVGDRYVMEALKSKAWEVGGENSGHIVLLQYTTTGDGIIAALQTIRALINRNQKLSEAKLELKKYSQVLINVRTKPELMNDILNNERVKNVVAEVEEELKKNNLGRLLLRKSGTEPLIRVMVETLKKEDATNFAQKIANEIENAI